MRNRREEESQDMRQEEGMNPGDHLEPGLEITQLGNKGRLKPGTLGTRKE